MNKPRTIIVNEKDEIIWYKDRWDIKTEDIYRVSALLIKNSKWEFLLAQRWYKKRNNPWEWNVSVAWTVEEWETYEENIIHEIEEEIWIKDIEIKEFDKIRRYWEHNYFVQLYVAILDKDIGVFKIEKDEVEDIRWFSVDEIKKWIFNWNKVWNFLTDNIDLFC